MQLYNNPLLDKDFLLELDKGRNRTTYVRLTAFTFDEHPLEYIEGRAVQGSLNLDGKSAVRRTCSLSLVADKLDIHDFYWSVKSKFKLEIGIENTINKEYDGIIWFPFGIYVINSFSTSQSINNFTVSISGKDKMCMLNGEVGGHFNSSVDLGTIEYTDKNGKKIIEKYPIKNIIREMIHQYGNEPFHNIIINDLDDYGVILEEYRGDTPLYLFREVNSDEFRNMTLNEDFKVVLNDNEISLKDLDETFNYDKLNSFTIDDSYVPTAIQLNKNTDDFYYIAKIEYGQTPGYTLTDITYPGDLIAAIGDAITSILDKIVQMLGNFEYFYDIDGRFVFQKKQAYKSTNESIVDPDGEMYSENAAMTSAVVYSFDNSELVQSISNNPNIMNVKNDFAVWGMRRSVTGNELPVHMRYAIDKKPVSYTQFEVTPEEVELYNTIYEENMPTRPKEECKTFSANDWDWRELIYQMAKDYRQYNHLDGFEAKIAQANPDLYPTGKTGYEQYYIDMEGFWRQLYDPDFGPEYFESVYNENAELNRYVKTYTLIDKEKDTKYEDYYVIENDNLIKYIDSIPLNNKNYYIKNGEEYQLLIDTLNLEQYTLYDSNKILLTDGKDLTKIYIENSVGRKIPIRDDFHIFNIDGDNPKERTYIFNNNKEVDIEFRLSDKGTPINTVNDIRKYWQELYYKTEEMKEFKEVTNSLKVYVKRDRDFKDKILYIQDVDGDYVSFNNSQSVSDKLTYLIKNNDDFINVTNLLKPNRSELYYLEGEDYKLLKDNLSYKEGLYKENFEKPALKKNGEVKKDDYGKIIMEGNYINIDDLDANLKSLYLTEDNKYKKYLYFATYNFNGQLSEYYPLEKQKIQYYEQYFDYNSETFNEDGTRNKKSFWHKNVEENPEQLNFWIDFLDLDGELDHFSIPVIGNRSKPINDSTVKAIYFRDTPTVLFTDNINNVDKKSGYTYIQIQPGMQNLFNMSSQGKSAKNVIEEALYNYAYCADVISLTTIPIYYLQPNTRIFVRDDNNFINGEYIIDKISIPLAYNGLMSISANKAIERILY